MKTYIKVLAITLIMSLCLCGCGKSAKWQEQYDLGVRYLSEGNYEEAILSFTQAIEIDPKSAEAYLLLAEVYLEMGDLEAAEWILLEGLEQAEVKDALQEQLDAVRQQMEAELEALAAQQAQEEAEQAAASQEVVESEVTEEVEEAIDPNLFHEEIPPYEGKYSNLPAVLWMNPSQIMEYYGVPAPDSMDDEGDYYRCNNPYTNNPDGTSISVNVSFDKVNNRPDQVHVDLNWDGMYDDLPMPEDMKEYPSGWEGITMGMEYREVLGLLGLGGEVPEGIWIDVMATQYPESDGFRNIFWNMDMTGIEMGPDTFTPCISIWFGDSLTETELYRVMFGFNEELRLEYVTFTNEWEDDTE